MIILIGASASGKTEAAKLLSERYGINKAITHTSRQPRINESPDVDYHYVSINSFNQLKNKNAFVETTEYNGNLYGCSKKEIGNDKCVVVDPNGLKSFLALNDKSIITFYLEASETTRRQRMLTRGDSLEDIEKRLSNDRVSFSEEALVPTDFRISTDRRPLVDIVSEIYERYQSLLSSKGLAKKD